jgi:hypothetical protein
MEDLLSGSIGPQLSFRELNPRYDSEVSDRRAKESLK